MTWLLDTNVISETIRPRPHLSVSSWLASQQWDDLSISVVTLAEIREGMAAYRATGARFQTTYHLVLLAQSANGTAEAETCYLKALGVARAQQARRLEGRATGPGFAQLVDQERKRSHANGGRSVFGWEPPPKRSASG